MLFNEKARKLVPGLCYWVKEDQAITDAKMSTKIGLAKTRPWVIMSIYKMESGFNVIFGCPLTSAVNEDIMEGSEEPVFVTPKGDYCRIRVDQFGPIDLGSIENMVYKLPDECFEYTKNLLTRMISFNDDNSDVTMEKCNKKPYRRWSKTKSLEFLKDTETLDISDVCGKYEMTESEVYNKIKYLRKRKIS